MKVVLLGYASLVGANIFYDISQDDLDQFKKSRNFTGKVVLVTGSDSGIGGYNQIVRCIGRTDCRHRKNSCKDKESLRRSGTIVSK